MFPYLITSSVELIACTALVRFTIEYANVVGFSYAQLSINKREELPNKAVDFVTSRYQKKDEVNSTKKNI